MSDSYIMIDGGFGLKNTTTKDQKDKFMSELRDFDANIEEYASGAYSFTIVDAEVMQELRVFFKENVTILEWLNCEEGECYPVDYFQLDDLDEEMEDE